MAPSFLWVVCLDLRRTENTDTSSHILVTAFGFYKITRNGAKCHLRDTWEGCLEWGQARRVMTRIFILAVIRRQSTNLQVSISHTYSARCYKSYCGLVVQPFYILWENNSADLTHVSGQKQYSFISCIMT